MQQDILETFLDRGELRKLAEPTLQPHGRRIPAFKLDHARQLAVMSSLVRFSHVAAGDTFTTAELQAAAANGNGKRATQLRMTLGLEVFTASFYFRCPDIRATRFFTGGSTLTRLRFASVGVLATIAFLVVFRLLTSVFFCTRASLIWR